jgi:organic hydroperoxide reductase OsmC/OhrA
MKHHYYNTDIKWTGNSGKGTSNYTAYERSHTISVNGKAIIHGSSDPSFRGDKTKYNPEELFVSSLSTCHMLWYLHLCSEAGIIVIDYADNATGTMLETKDGGGHFIAVTLHPTVVVSNKSMIERANELHDKANKLCFIAGSCNFPIHHKPNCIAENA